MSKLNIIFSSYLAIIIGLFFYSYTQVDLNLTLSQWSTWQVIEKFFQHVGYFQRPFSTLLYVSIILLLSIFYLIFVYLAKAQKIEKRQVWFLIGATSMILFLSYNAFSYDLFNYIFDAKIVTYYHQNPYEHKALDYQGDPMLNFMRWTHRTYPYGPTWLLLTVPLSFVGSQVFLVTAILFKVLVATSYLGTAYFIGRIAKKIYPKEELLATVFFALNPLVIIESLVSAHNDIVMILFALWSIYLLISRKFVRSIFIFIISVGVKFASLLLLPGYVIYFLFHNSNNVRKVIHTMLLCMIIAVLLASIRTNFQPWYLLYVLPFSALYANIYYVMIPATVISIFATLQYVPYLYSGNWDPPIPFILSLMTTFSILLSFFITLIFFVKARNKVIK